MEQFRAYSVLKMHGSNEEQRVIRGMATTPTPDRVGDIVEPMGMEFAAEMPLLWHHKSDKPVGHVKFGKPTKNGIPFEAKILSIPEAGVLKDRLDEAWQSVKYRLVAGVSIGFKALETAYLRGAENTITGIRFVRSHCYELSLVTIPANAEATITQIKSLDAAVLAHLGTGTNGPERLATPDPSGRLNHVNKGLSHMNIQAQIAALETQRTQKATRFQEIQTTVTSAGRAKTEQEKAEFDTLRDELKAFDDELQDLHDVEKLTVVRTAQAIQPHGVGANGGVQMSRQGNGLVPATVKTADSELDFVRLVKCRYVSRKEIMPLEEVAKRMYGYDSNVYGLIAKANEILPGTAASGNWGYDLISQEGRAAGLFLEFLRSKSIIGKFGTNGIPALNGGLGFYEPYVTQTGEGTGYWVGEALAKGVTNFDFDRSTLTPLKMANIVVLSQENMRRSSPQSDTVIRDQMVKALSKIEDQTFIQPGNSGTSNIKPASITNGAETVAATGTGDADDIRLDIRALLKKFTDAENDPSTGVLIMGADSAVALGTMTNALGQPEFPGIGLGGGMLLGLPVIVSNYASNTVVMVNASDILYIDEGVMIDTSTEASIEMRSTTTHNAATPTHGQLVSLWQNNMIGFLAEKTVNWKRLRAQSVAYLTGVAWGGAVPAS